MYIYLVSIFFGILNDFFSLKIFSILLILFIRNFFNLICIFFYSIYAKNYEIIKIKFYPITIIRAIMTLLAFYLYNLSLKNLNIFIINYCNYLIPIISYILISLFTKTKIKIQNIIFSLCVLGFYFLFPFSLKFILPICGYIILFSICDLLIIKSKINSMQDIFISSFLSIIVILFLKIIYKISWQFNIYCVLLGFSSFITTLGIFVSFKKIESSKLFFLRYFDLIISYLFQN